MVPFAAGGGARGRPLLSFPCPGRKGTWQDLAIYNAGVETVYAPVLPLGGSLLARNGGGAKSLADTAMAVDVTDLLNLMPGVTTLVMATSDKDLIPVLRFAQRRGLQAIVVGSDRTAGALKG